MIEFVATYFSYAQLFVMFLIITCGSLGIILICLMLGREAITQILKHTRGYAAFIDFVWHRERFKKWMDEK